MEPRSGGTNQPPYLVGIDQEEPDHTAYQLPALVGVQEEPEHQENAQEADHEEEENYHHENAQEDGHEEEEDDDLQEDAQEADQGEQENAHGPDHEEEKPHYNDDSEMEKGERPVENPNEGSDHESKEHVMATQETKTSSGSGSSAGSKQDIAQEIQLEESVGYSGEQRPYADGDYGGDVEDNGDHGDANGDVDNGYDSGDVDNGNGNVDNGYDDDDDDSEDEDGDQRVYIPTENVILQGMLAYHDARQVYPTHSDRAMDSFVSNWLHCDADPRLIEQQIKCLKEGYVDGLITDAEQLSMYQRIFGSLSESSSGTTTTTTEEINSAAASAGSSIVQEIGSIENGAAHEINSTSSNSGGDQENGLIENGAAHEINSSSDQENSEDAWIGEWFYS